MCAGSAVAVSASGYYSNLFKLTWPRVAGGYVIIAILACLTKRRMSFVGGVVAASLETHHSVLGRSQRTDL